MHKIRPLLELYRQAPCLAAMLRPGRTTTSGVLVGVAGRIWQIGLAQQPFIAALTEAST